MPNTPIGGSKLRVLFMGSPDFAIPSLRSLVEHYEVVAVVTQPDRPRGRGRSLAPPPVKVEAARFGLEVLQPERVRRRSVREKLASYQADLFVVVAFGQILSPRVLALPRLGCINVHASLLPRHRGAAPIQWSVLSGDRESGVTIMLMDAGVDTGPTLLAETVALSPHETAGSLHDRLAPLGARALVRAIDGYCAGELEPHPQREELATEAPMLRKQDGRVDFTRPAAAVDRWIRGMDPWPGAFTSLAGSRLRLHESRPAPEERGAPGEVLAADDRGLLVGCGEGGVWIRELQLPGRRRMSAASLVAGHPIPTGTRLGEE